MALSLRYYRGQTATRSLYMGLSAAVGSHPSPGNELFLGGDTGLRGYPSHFHVGDTRYQVTIEERFFTRFHPLRLARVGFALFIDVGRVFLRDGESRDRNSSEDGLLADIGFGLRLVPSKSDKGEVIHIDIAFPLSDRLEADSYQITAELKKSL
jgi:outer membrane protein assembly factor BamA